MRIKSQDEILDPAVRKKIIDEIEGTENKRRKDEAYRRAQVNKDKTSTFVVNLLLQQFSEVTVREMSYAITNISLVRKIINKLARVYQGRVQRSVDESEEGTEKLQELSKLYSYDQFKKGTDRSLRLQKNTAFYLKPCPFFDNEGNKLMRVRPTVLSPYLYDVVEDFWDRTRPMVYVLSNYAPTSLLYTSLDPARVRFNQLGAGFGNATQVSSLASSANKLGDKTDQVIADKKEDEDEPNESDKEYIWWSGKYHFTTNSKGEMIGKDKMPLGVDLEGEGLQAVLNPIEELPIVNYAIDQDGSFWAEGGEDLVDAGIVANSLMSQANHIAVTQGYGQFFMTGKNLPRNVPIGPSTSIILEYDKEEDPKPEIGFASANPPLSELREQIESQVALTLTTNNLTTSGVSTSLNQSGSFASGIALMIDKAESNEETQDLREMFADKEADEWRIIFKWNNFFKEENILDPEFEDLLMPEDTDVTIRFNDPKAIVTEKERLDNLKIRKKLGLNTQIQLIKMDNPDLNDDQAAAHLKEIEEENKKRMEEAMENAGAFGEQPSDEEEENEGEEDDSDQE